MNKQKLTYAQNYETPFTIDIYKIWLTLMYIYIIYLITSDEDRKTNWSI